MKTDICGLQHAAHHAICILLQGNSKTITQLSGMSSPLHKTINDLGLEVTTTTEIEPFYEDEPKQELGFSFENQVSRKFSQRPHQLLQGLTAVYPW